MSDLSDFLPNGLDWADGLDGRPGQATPEEARVVRGGNGDGTWFEESPDSPDIERGEQATIRHTYFCDYDISGIALIGAIGRGTVLIDSFGNETRVLTADLTRMKGNEAKFVVTAESISFDTPPDEFDLDPTEINPEIEKHPKYIPIMGDGQSRYPYNENSTGGVIDSTLLTGPRIVEIAKSAANAASQGQGTESLDQLNSTGVPDASVLALALDLYKRFLRGETTFYLDGLTLTWSVFFWSVPGLDAGGYIQDPITEGSLPDYFWLVNADTGEQIFDTTLLTNPDIWASGISWLRKSDKINYSRTWFKLTRTWIGAPLGHWDAGIYPKYGA